MKKILISVGTLAALALAVYLLVASLTSGMTDNSDALFKTVGKGAYAKAYSQYLSSEFKNTTTLEKFQAYMIHTGLDRYHSATWGSRSYAGDTGELEGTIITDLGGRIPVTLTMVKEDHQWLIHHINAIIPGLTTQETGKTVPSLPVLEEMAGDTLRVFILSIRARNFDEFHRQISALWQSQISSEELLSAFRVFVDNDIDLTPYLDLKPIFNDPPMLDEQGVLLLKGYVPLYQDQLHFDMDYVYEYPEWKLLGIHVTF